MFAVLNADITSNVAESWIAIIVVSFVIVRNKVLMRYCTKLLYSILMYLSL